MNLFKSSVIAPGLALLLYANTLSAQSYTTNTSSLKEAIQEISKIAKIPYLVDSSILENKVSKKITKVEGLKNALDLLLKNSGLEAIIKDNTIVIRKKLLPTSSKVDITHEVLSYEENAYENIKGYIARKSSTGSKMNMDINKIPQSVAVITSDLMRSRNAQTINNAVSYTSGISQEYGENGDIRRNTDTIRASGMLASSTFLDALQVPFLGYFGRITDIYSLQKVEVLKGPSSVLYGASSPGGLLNMQSKKPNLEDKNEVGIANGSYNSKSIFADLNTSLNKNILFRLTGKYKKSKGEVDFVENTNYFINPAFTFYINDNTTLDVLTSFSKNNMLAASYLSGNTGELVFHKNILKHYSHVQTSADSLNNANLSSRMYLGDAKDDKLKRSTQSITTLLKHKINDSLSINSNLRIEKNKGEYIQSRLDNNYLPTMIGTANLSTIRMTKDKELSSLDSISFDNNIQYSWQTKDITNQSMIGIDYHHQKLELEGYEDILFLVDLFNPYSTQNIAKNSQIDKKETESINKLAFYAQNQAIINDRIILSTALRYDKIKQINDDTFNDTKQKQKDTNLSGRIGLAYAFDNGFSPYISYSTSFVTNPGTNKQKKQYVPSLGKQIEIGAKYKPKNIDALLSFSFYNIKEENILSSDPTNSTSESFQIQDSSSDIKGIEIDLSFQTSKNTNIIFSLSKISAKQRDTTNAEHEGRDMERIPDLSLSLWADYTLKNTALGNITLASGIKYIGNIKHYITDSFDPLKKEDTIVSDSYLLVDSRISSQYKDFNLSFAVNNVFDKTPEIDPTIVRSTFLQGRTYNIAMTYKF